MAWSFLEGEAVGTVYEDLIVGTATAFLYWLIMTTIYRPRLILSDDFVIVHNIFHTHFIPYDFFDKVIVEPSFAFILQGGRRIRIIAFLFSLADSVTGGRGRKQLVADRIIRRVEDRNNRQDLDYRRTFHFWWPLLAFLLLFFCGLLLLNRYVLD